MKINFLCFISSANMSGATKITLDIIKLLDKERFNIRIIFSKYNHKALYKLKLLRELKIKFTILNKVLPLWITRYNTGLKLERIIMGLFGKLIILLKVKALFFQFKPDIVYSNSVLFPNFNLRKYIQHSKIFYHLHLQKNNIEKLSTYIIDNLNIADRVIAISHNQKKLLINKGVKENVLSLFYESICPFDFEQERGADAEYYKKFMNYRDDDIIIGSCGGISYRKGFDLFIEVASMICANGNNKIKFLCIGSGDIKDIQDYDVSINVAEHIDRLQNRFYLTGVVTNPHDYLNISNMCDIFVVCSRFEGIPLAMLDNMYLGKPVIAFDNGGTGEALSGAGILVKDRDVEEMARQVIRLAGDAEERKRLGMIAKRRIQQDFDLSKNIKALERLFIGSLN